MFINVSNHPSDKWGADQYEAAAQHGEVIDLPFPAIEPRLDREAVLALAQDYYARICAIAGGQTDTDAHTDAAGNLATAASRGSSPQDTTVMVSGEFTFTYHLVALLLQGGYHAVSACTRRDAIETVQPDGSVVKTARFTFVQFREY